MKQLIIIAALFLVSFSARAQATGITITNSSNCDLFFELIGDAGCGVKYTSPLMYIGPTQTLTFPSITGAGLTCSACSPVTLTTGVFTGVRIFDNNTTSNCPITTYDVGEPCVGLPPTATYPEKVGDCSVCGNAPISATYTPANSGPMAWLIFF